MELVNVPCIVEHPEQHPVTKQVFAAKCMTVCTQWHVQRLDSLTGIRACCPMTDSHVSRAFGVSEPQIRERGPVLVNVCSALCRVL